MVLLLRIYYMYEYDTTRTMMSWIFFSLFFSLFLLLTLIDIKWLLSVPDSIPPSQSYEHQTRAREKKYQLDQAKFSRTDRKLDTWIFSLPLLQAIIILMNTERTNKSFGRTRAKKIQVGGILWIIIMLYKNVYIFLKMCSSERDVQEKRRFVP